MTNNPPDSQEIARRIANANLSFPGQVVRLDLYRLLCSFLASKQLSELSDGSDWCPYQPLRDEFEISEIIRILVSSAVAIRGAAQGNFDEHRAAPEFLEQSVVGTLVRNLVTPTEESLNLREACNKIIHARHTEVVRVGDGDPYTDYLRATVILHSEFDGMTGWRASLDILRYAAAGSQIAEQFS